MPRTIVPGFAPRPRVRGEALRRRRELQGSARVTRASRPVRATRDQTLASNVAFPRRRGAAPPVARALFRLRPLPLVASFVLVAGWFFTNVRQLSPLDVLPFAWTWLTLWVAASVVAELWRRYTGQSARSDGASG
jgi:hypothetical protein